MILIITFLPTQQTSHLGPQDCLTVLLHFSFQYILLLSARAISHISLPSFLQLSVDELSPYLMERMEAIRRQHAVHLPQLHIYSLVPPSPYNHCKVIQQMLLPEKTCFELSFSCLLSNHKSRLSS